MSKKKVAIVYPYFAHYRYPIIDQLASDTQIEYYFLSGETSVGRVKDLKLVDFTTRKNYIKLKNLWFFKYFLWQRGLISELRDSKYDAVIIFADWKYISTWIAIIYLTLKNTPVIFWSHGFWSYKKNLNDYIKLSYFKLYRNGGFVYDHRAKDVFAKLNFKPNIDVIYNSLDYDKQTALLKNVVGNQDKIIKLSNPYLVFSGRLTPIKKVELLLDSLKLINYDGEKINLVIIGDGSQKENLIQIAKAYKLTNSVVFFGSCYDEEIIANIFYNSIACVIPSGIGLSAIHSLTYGVPVITNNNNLSHGPEIEALIDNYNAKFFVDNDAASLAEQILFFLNLSDEKKSEYRNNSLQVVRDKFNPNYQREVISRRLTELLNIDD